MVFTCDEGFSIGRRDKRGAVVELMTTLRGADILVTDSW
jgi:hypothetical protein